MSVLVANGVSEAQRIARYTRSQQAQHWTDAVEAAKSLVAGLGPDVCSYREFVLKVASKADIDVPTAKRVFDYLENCNVVVYDFGVGVRQPAK